MKKGYTYTILFMVVLSIILSLALASAYEAFKPRIDDHARLREQRAVLSALGQGLDLADKDVPALFDKVITKGDLKGIDSFVYKDGDTVKGYAVPFEGSGLWGSIAGFLGVDETGSVIKGLVFTRQSETPGLGGRIEEPVFLNQFRDITLVPGQGLHYGQNGDKTLDAITGATQTSNAVMKMVNATISEMSGKEEAK